MVNLRHVNIAKQETLQLIVLTGQTKIIYTKEIGRIG